MDTSDKWIIQRTGISSRYVSETENTSDLAYQASLQAIEDANIQREDIDVIIVATMTPDCMTPSTACLVQAKLGLNDCPIFAFDINGACSGFLYAFQIASDLLSRYEHILVIGSETISKMIDWNDRSTCVLFGDGAGAMILGRGATQLYHYANSEGDTQQVLQADGLSLVQDLQNNEPSTHYLNMKGNDVFRFAVKVLKESIEHVLAQSNLTMDDIDLVIPHQANYRIISHVAKKMKVDLSKFYMNLQEFGNTSAASIPIAYAMAQREGKIPANGRVILVGFGAGLTYGATLIDNRGGQ
ncbi:ketoacyl-ACP synthase III [Allocoprobacillus halotolerans]|uniref:Beta-ketoacyl-[acyl-carrier-protein] synthase III n=1 Tax=Allocoprobacillus halotolerans TaxID=2944914 RepID=A0ABY5I2L1_9FIRM|nr:beta-ketoacyl-ACP synthase III [Allocoprobacillus halotolerans]UTY38308.1 ketoacyl-ACP synthase III [Allocoprobacillus halotolerans]